MRQPPPLGVVVGCQQASEEGFETDHFHVATGQGADGDERLPEMSRGLCAGQPVKPLVGERDAPLKEPYWSNPPSA